MPIDWSLYSMVLNLVPYQTWLEIGLGLSVFLNLIFAMVAIGILFPKPGKVKLNSRLVDITVGGLFGLLGSFFTSAISGEGAFGNPYIRGISFAAFVGILIALCYRIFTTPE